MSFIACTFAGVFASLTQTPQMHVFSTSLLFVLFGFPLASLYCNALLANLNARSYIRGEGMGHDASADLVTMNSPVSGESMAENRSGEARPEFISSICLVSFTRQLAEPS